MDPSKRYDNSGAAFADDIAELYSTPEPDKKPEEDTEEEGPCSEPS